MLEDDVQSLETVSHLHFPFFQVLNCFLPIVEIEVNDGCLQTA